jgi:TRAP-type uncharacterized transport system fused permease subunit
VDAQRAESKTTLAMLTARIVTAVGVSLSIYQLYTAGVTALTALVQRSIHLAAILALTFLLKPAFKSAPKGPRHFWT